jgi:hypothetical protein
MCLMTAEFVSCRNEHHDRRALVQLQALFFSTKDGNERPSSFFSYFFPMSY